MKALCHDRYSDPRFTFVLTRHFHSLFAEPSSIKSETSTPASCQRSPYPNHSMTITIHRRRDNEGAIAGRLNGSAGKLLFNVRRRGRKQSVVVLKLRGAV